MDYSAFQVIGSPVVVFDRHGHIKFMNSSFEELASKELFELQEDGSQERIDLAAHLLNISKTILGSSCDPNKRPICRSAAISYITSEGRELYFEVQFSLVGDEKQLDTIALIRDVTEQKELELELDRKEEFLWLLMFNLPIGLIFVNSETKSIEDLNLEAARILGKDREFLLNKKCSEVFECKNGHCIAVTHPDLTHKNECFLLKEEDSKIPVIRTVKLLSRGDANVIMEAFLDLTERKRLEEQLVSLSITDSLTGIHNRRYFVAKVNEEIDRAKRYGDLFSIVMFDLDHFKSINDIYGHLVGDRVLFETAQIVKNRLRCTDVFARWGGEEFIILLPSTPVDGAISLAEELRQKIAENDYGLERRVTASFGVAPYLPGDTIDTLTQRADAMLYAAKNGGRNCTRVFQVD
jgi:diguanylate cyclase (GGDEF)-like protein/PAS domain S-box-containing protein